MSLWTFSYTHFKVNTITNDIYFRRIKTIEEISVIPILITNGILIPRKTLTKQFLVIDVTLLHIKYSCKIFRRINSITYPCNITDIVFLTFLYLKIYIYMTVIVCTNAILEDSSITKTEFVIFLYKTILSFCETLRSEFL